MGMINRKRRPPYGQMGKDRREERGREKSKEARAKGMGEISNLFFSGSKIISLALAMVLLLPQTGQLSVHSSLGMPGNHFTLG